MLLTFAFRDYLDFPSYPQSFDIAVSPDLRNSKSQGKGDRNRREKYVSTYVSNFLAVCPSPVASRNNETHFTFSFSANFHSDEIHFRSS